ncbi:MAG: DUF2971 domain-containing protein [Methanosarcinaceae archaeon]
MKPDKLFYKHQRIENDDSNYTIENLSKYQLYFNDPTKFNDFFDCKIHYVYRGKEEDWADLLKREGYDSTQIKKHIKLRIDDEIIEKEGDLLILYPTNENYRAKNEPFLHGDIHKKNLPQVCCFTETDDNILMWSHYADNHQGICLRFRSNQAADRHFLTLNSTVSPFFKVEYKDDFPPEVNMFDNNRHQAISKFLVTKYSDWGYEKEYRMLLFEDKLEKGTIKYKKEDLEGIIFGLKIEPKNVERIYNTIDEKYLKEGTHVNFYEAREIRGKYKIQIVKINDIGTYLDSLG